MTDLWTVRAVVISLAAVTLAGLAMIGWLVSTGASGESIALVSSPTTTALGALSAVLVSTRTQQP